MDLFPDGAHVRLRSRARDMYLHADDDGVGVSLSPRRASLNAAWRVHRIDHDGGTCVLLHGAAYGRYLAATDEKAPPGHRGQLVVQGVYDNPAAIAVMWNVDAVEGGYVLLRHVSYRFLRANGRYLTRNTGVTIGKPGNRSTMMQWVVEALPLLPAPPILQAQIPAAPGVVVDFLARFRRRTAPLPQRTIRYVRADYFGNFDDHDWDSFQFHGHSVFGLRTQVAVRVGQPLFFANITVCARAGCYGRLTPLTVDLPRSHEPMDIVALTFGSPATEQLEYPDVDAP